MITTVPTIRRLLIAIIPSSLLLLVALFVYAYQRHALNDFQSKRSFRALNMLGNQIQSAVDAQEAMVTRRGKDNTMKDQLIAPLTFVSLRPTAQAFTAPSGSKSLNSSNRRDNITPLLWRIDLAKVVKPLMRLDIFDLVLVTTHDGTVLVQDSKMLFRIVDLRSLVGGSIGRTKAGEPTPIIGEVKTVTDIAPYSNDIIVNMSGHQYTFSLYPLMLKQTAENGKHDNHLVLVGVTKLSEFTPSMLSDPAYVEFLFMFSITLLVGWPSQKLIGLTPGQRFRRRDGLLLVVSSILLMSMVTLLFLDFYYDSLWERDTDTRLKLVAQQINDHFTAELNRDYDYLTSLGDKAQSDVKTLTEGCVSLPKSGKVPPGVLHPNVLVTHEDFPFESAEWLNENGLQRIKWSIHEKIEPCGLRNDRPYFTNLKNGSTYGLKQAPRKQFSLQPLHSWDTGQNLTVMGISLDPPPQQIPSVSAPGGREKRPCLTARVAGIQLNSVGSIVLPSNIQFAVVDEIGSVFYHSDETRVQVENFLEECERNKHLVAARLKRAGGNNTGEPLDANTNPFESDYDGKPRRLYVQALGIDRLPWSVIVYADSHTLEQQEGRVLRKALLFFVMYGLTMALALWLLYLRRTGWWIPPSWHEVPVRLACLSAINVLIMTCFSLLIVSAETTIVSLVAFFCPVLAIAATSIALSAKFNLPPWLNTTATPTAWKIRHLTLLGWPQFSAPVSLVILVCVLPCFGFWKVAFVHHREAVIRQGQIELADSMERRDQRLATQYETIRFRGKETGTLPCSRASESFDLYYNAFFESRTIRPDYSCRDDRQIRSVGQWFKQVSIGSEQWFRRVSMGLEDPEDERWSRDGKDFLLYRAGFGRIISTHLPPQELPANTLVLGQIAAALILFCTLMYYAAYWLLNLDRKFAATAMNEGLANSSDRNLLLTGAPRSGKSALLLKKQETIYIINLLDYSSDSLMALSVQSPWPHAGETIAIDQLEYGIDDPKWNLATLQLLERLVYRSKQTVILVSNVNPIFYMRNESTVFSSYGMGDSYSQQRLARWVDLLASFQWRDFKKDEDFTLCREASAQTYQAIWRSCSGQERAVLLNLAQDGVVNPKNSALVLELCKAGRGILVKNPILRFRDPKFGFFIRDIYGPDQLLSWDRAMRGNFGMSSWNVFLGAFVLVGIGLSFRGYEALGPAIASISGIINLGVTVRSQFVGQPSKNAGIENAKTE